MGLLTTDPITYNLNSRGRAASGIPRNYKSVPAIVAAINSPRTQEMVKRRDLLGFFSHVPRRMFGLFPLDNAGFVGGQQKTFLPAFVTTSLTAAPDGTVTHVAEFLDTEPGRAACDMWKAKVGGFSTAIDENSSPVLFAGLDYVGIPNYDGNRGYTLDSGADDGVSGDIAAYMAMVNAVRMTLDSGGMAPGDVLAAFGAAQERIARLERENVELLAIAARRGVSAQQARLTLDSGAGFSLGVTLDSGADLQRAHDAWRATDINAVNRASMAASDTTRAEREHDSAMARVLGVLGLSR